MKKVLMFILSVFSVFICLDVYAASNKVNIYFYAYDATVTGDNFKIENRYVVYNKKDAAVYDYSGTINNINSISNKKFELSKDGNSLKKKYEWFAYHFKSGEKVYFDQSKKYKVSTFCKKLGISKNTSNKNIILYANYATPEYDADNNDVVDNDDNKDNNTDSNISTGDSSDMTIEMSDISISSDSSQYVLSKKNNIIINNSSINLVVDAHYKSNGNASGVEWSVSDKDVASIDSNGVLTAKKIGNITVTAKSGDQTKTIKLRVFDVSLEKSNLTVNKGADISVNVLYKYVSTKNEKTMVDPSVLELDNYNITLSESTSYSVDNSSLKNGIIKLSNVMDSVKDQKVYVNGILVGSLNISVTNNVKITSISVDKKQTGYVLSGLKKDGSLSDKNYILYKSNVGYKLSSNAVYEGSKLSAPVKWSVNNGDIASIDSDGVLSITGTGDVVVTATSGNKSVSVTLGFVKMSLSSNNVTLTGKDLSTSLVVKYHYGKSTNYNFDYFKFDNYKLKVSDSSNASSEYYSISDGSLKNGTIKITSKKAYDNHTASVYLNDIKIGAFNIYISNSTNSGNTAEFRFLGNQSDSGNEAIVFKDVDNKIYMIDTGNNQSKYSCEQLVHDVALFAGKNSTKDVTIETLFLSHYHPDHVGCLDTVVKNVGHINNVVYKEIGGGKTTSSSGDLNYYGKIMNTIKSSGKVSNMKKTNNLSDGGPLELGDASNKKHLTAFIYNVSDVFEGINCSLAAGYPMKFERLFDRKKSTREKFITYRVTDKNGNEKILYLGVDGKDTSKLVFLPDPTKDPDFKNGTTTSDINQMKFYAKYLNGKEKDSGCNQNTNSLAILIRVPVGKNDYRYVYIPSDLENNGYAFFGSAGKDDKNNTDGGLAYGTATLRYKINGTYDRLDNYAKNQTPPVTIARSYGVAKAIRSQLGNDLNKIVIYQNAHHGSNDTEETINTLNLNRSVGYNNEPLYTVTLYNTYFDSSKQAAKAKARYKTMKNAYESGYNITTGLSADSYAHFVFDKDGKLTCTKGTGGKNVSCTGGK